MTPAESTLFGGGAKDAGSLSEDIGAETWSPPAWEEPPLLPVRAVACRGKYRSTAAFLIGDGLTLFRNPRPVMELPSFLGFVGADSLDFPMPTLFLIPRPVIEDILADVKVPKAKVFLDGRIFRGCRCRISLTLSRISHQKTRLLLSIDWGQPKPWGATTCQINAQNPGKK